MLFKYTVKYYNDTIIAHKKAKGKVFGTTYADAISDLLEYYDENNIESITVKLVDDRECVWEDSDEQIKVS